MFNFFLISVGILANAYVLLIIGNLRTLAGSLAVVSTIMCFIFVSLDRRNHQLVSLGEEALKSVEQSIWQRQESSCTNDERVSLEIGPLSQEQSLKSVSFYLKHWFLIESFESLVGIAFFIAAIYALVGRVS
jgi:hypothetical protein